MFGMELNPEEHVDEIVATAQTVCDAMERRNHELLYALRDFEELKGSSDKLERLEAAMGVLTASHMADQTYETKAIMAQRKLTAKLALAAGVDLPDEIREAMEHLLTTGRMPSPGELLGEGDDPDTTGTGEATIEGIDLDFVAEPERDLRDDA